MISPYLIYFDDDIQSRTNYSFNLICDLCFEGGDSGETNTFLSRKSVTTETYNGFFRRSYGMKYEDVFAPKITLMKDNYGDFTIEEMREVLAWLTGNHTSRFLNVFMTQDEWKSRRPTYCILGNVTEVESYKLGNNRTVGFVFTFESLYPYALSGLQSTTFTASKTNTSATKSFDITIVSDEPNSFIYPYLIITNKRDDYDIRIQCGMVNGSYFSQRDVIEIKNNNVDEIIIIDSANQIIKSETNPSRIFGNNFSWVWPKLQYGKNRYQFQMFQGNSLNKSSNYFPKVEFKYRYPIKCGEF